MTKRSPYKRLYRRWLIFQARHKRENFIAANKNMDKHIRFMAIMFFVGALSIGIFGTPTLLSWIQISRIYIILAVCFSFIPSKLLPKIYYVRKELKVLLAVCALAPVFTALILAVNYIVPINQTTQKYKVESYNVFYSDHIIEVKLENNKYKNKTEIRRFSTDSCPYEPDSAAYLIKTGVFGFDVVRHQSLIAPKNK